MSNEEKRLTIHVTPETLENLHVLADNRGLSLRELCRRLCDWAAKQDGMSLAKAGVNIPVFLGELDEKDSSS